GFARNAPGRNHPESVGEQDLVIHYLYYLKDKLSVLNVLGYITFRSGGAILTAFFLTWYLGPRFIAFIRRKQLTQTVRKDGPQSHLSKSGTPTMGGLLMLFTTVV